VLFFITHKGDSKELIIQILSEEWPLNLKKIHFRINRMGTLVSCQAVHKSLKQLVGVNVIKKIGSDYQINTSWLYSVNRQCDEISARYASKEPIPVNPSAASFRCEKPLMVQAG